MYTISLPHQTEEDFIFEGILLAEVDDRALASTANWWQLRLFQSNKGELIFSSTFWRNYPRIQEPLHSILFFQKLDDMYEHLVVGCYMPSAIANTLLEKAKKKIALLENPVQPLKLNIINTQEYIEEEDNIEYYDPIFVEEEDNSAALYRSLDRITKEEHVSSYI
ncbi:MAG: hypothetical protein ACRCV3_01000 [Desulfovibrionaceae bacterium]